MTTITDLETKLVIIEDLIRMLLLRNEDLARRFSSGGVTSIATGTGLSGGPITSIGTIRLANTAVTAGSYTLASFTVDAQGRLTAASSGTVGVLLIQSDGSAVTNYSTITLALSAATSGDVVWVARAGTFAESVTVPAGVSLVGLDRKNTIITGQVSLSSGSLVANLSVTRAANSSAELIAVLGPTSGTGYVYGCDLSATQSGAGDAIGIKGRGGIVVLEDCYLSGQSTSGNGYGSRLALLWSVTIEMIYTDATMTKITDTEFSAASISPYAARWNVLKLSGPFTSLPAGTMKFTWQLIDGSGDVFNNYWLNWPGNNLATTIDAGYTPTFSVEGLLYSEPGTMTQTHAGGTFASAPASDVYYVATRVEDTTTQFKLLEFFYVEGGGAERDLWQTGTDSGAIYLYDCRASGSEYDVSSETGRSTYVEGSVFSTKSGTVVSLAGDRSASDATAYPLLHTNDTDTGTSSLHHTIGTGANQAAAGNHSHTLDGLSDVNTTGVGTGDVIYKSSGDWVDYPLSIGNTLRSEGGGFEFGGASDYVRIDQTNGILTLNGAATTWDDVRISGSSARLGATAPSLGAFGPSGSIQTLRFNSGQHDEIYFEVQMPHAWKEGSKIYPHVHWTPIDATAGNVVWQLDYTWANVNGTFGAPTTLTSDATAAGGTAWVHKISPLKDGSGNAYIDGTGKTLSSMVVCRLHRDAGAGSDTLAQDVAFLEFDIHYEIDGFGSNEEYTK